MRWPIAVLLDLAALVSFVAIGRSVHGDGLALAGMASTTWPFLLGSGIGMTVARGWRGAEAIWPAGVGVWLGGAVVGMTIRVLAGQGSAVGFVVVTFAYLAATELGWRVLWAMVHRTQKGAAAVQK